MPLCHFSLDHHDRPMIAMVVSISTLDRPDDPAECPPPRIIQALVDTGAGQSHVAIDVLEDLGLGPVLRKRVYTASTGDEPEKMSEYIIDLGLAGDQPGAVARNLRVIGSDKLVGLRVDMLLGRDILDRCLLIYDGANRRFSLAYNPPAPIPA